MSKSSFSAIAFMSPEQCRAARAWLKISIDELARESEVSVVDIRSFELGRLSRKSDAAMALQSVLQQHGVFFVGTTGIVVLKKTASRSRPELSTIPHEGELTPRRRRKPEPARIEG